MSELACSDDFRVATHAQEIISGVGSVARLAEAVERFGWRRLMLCTSPALRRAGHVQAVQCALGDALAAIYDQTASHVQDYQLGEAQNVAAAHGVDAVIGLGGGSAIGMAKAVSFTLAEQTGGYRAHPATPPDPSRIPVIAIPTTYAGSEMTPVYGVTHHHNGSPRKVTVRDPKIAPWLVIYDSRLTIDLPPVLTASSGINALAHCVESLYSTHRNPLASAAAQSAAGHIARALPHCTADGSDLDARTEMLVGSHLAGFALSITAMGLHHGLCHVLGGSANVPHGIANAIILPHAMRFNLDATASQLAMLARAMGFCSGETPDEPAAEAAVTGVAEFIRQLGLPQHLREVGVSEDRLPSLAEMALQSRAVQDNPKQVGDAGQIEAVLRAAW